MKSFFREVTCDIIKLVLIKSKETIFIFLTMNLWFSCYKNGPFIVFSILMVVNNFVFEFSLESLVFYPRLLVFTCVANLLLLNNFNSLVSKKCGDFIVTSSKDVDYFLIVEEVLPLA